MKSNNNIDNKDNKPFEHFKDNNGDTCDDQICYKKSQLNEDAPHKKNNQNNPSNSNGIPTDINEKMTKFLIYRIPIWRSLENENKCPHDFIVDIKDISDEVKEHLISFPKKDQVAIVKEAVSLLFENLGPKEKEYFNKNVRHLLKVRCI